LASDRETPEAAATPNLVWHAPALARAQREKNNGHRGAVVWLTGLPGSGKSTVAHAAEESLHRSGFKTAVLDGDNIRHGLCADLGFSVADRNENIRRVGEVAKLFLELGIVVFVALVSPLRSARENVRRSMPDGDFIEIFCDCPLAVCRQRDPKGMYAQAERGLIPEFTGISAPYEAPIDRALILKTAAESVEESVSRVSRFLLGKLGRVSAVEN